MVNRFLTKGYQDNFNKGGTFPSFPISKNEMGSFDITSHSKMNSNHSV